MASSPCSVFSLSSDLLRITSRAQCGPRALLSWHWSAVPLRFLQLETTVMVTRELGVMGLTTTELVTTELQTMGLEAMDKQRPARLGEHRLLVPRTAGRRPPPRLE